MAKTRFGNYHSPGPLQAGRRWSVEERLDDMLAIARLIEQQAHSADDLARLRRHVEALGEDLDALRPPLSASQDPAPRPS